MSSYQGLSEIELRTYVKQHPNDEDAFQHYLSIVRARPGVVVSTEEQAVIEFQRRIQIESTP